MKVGNLDMHCGECGVIDFCGCTFGYSICSDKRFKHVDTDEYKRIAEQIPQMPSITEDDFSFDDCGRCNNSGVLDDEQDCEECDRAETEKDRYAQHVADYVYSQLTERECSNCGEKYKSGDVADGKLCCSDCLEHLGCHCEGCGQETLLGTTEVRTYDKFYALCAIKDVCKVCMESYVKCEGLCNDYIPVDVGMCDDCLKQIAKTTSS